MPPCSLWFRRLPKSQPPFCCVAAASQPSSVIFNHASQKHGQRHVPCGATTVHEGTLSAAPCKGACCMHRVVFETAMRRQTVDHNRANSRHKPRLVANWQPLSNVPCAVRHLFRGGSLEKPVVHVLSPATPMLCTTSSKLLSEMPYSNHLSQS